MKSPGLSNNVLMLIAAVGLGYLVTSVYFHFFPPAEPPVAFHPPRMVENADPETVLAQTSAGVDLPPEVRQMMLGQPVRSSTSARSEPPPPAQTNYAFIIGEHLQEQVVEMRERLLSPAGAQQENGETVETLEAQAREGRMSW